MPPGPTDDRDCSIGRQQGRGRDYDPDGERGQTTQQQKVTQDATRTSLPWYLPVQQHIVVSRARCRSVTRLWNFTSFAFALFVGDGNSLFRWGDYLQLKHPRSAGPMQNVDAFTRLIQIPGASP